jgi:hypothetical protein
VLQRKGRDFLKIGRNEFHYGIALRRALA